jgi:hypothetical protein
MALIEAGLSLGEPEASELHPGVTNIVDAMNYFSDFALLFTPPIPTSLSLFSGSGYGQGGSLSSKIVGVMGGKDMTGKPSAATSHLTVAPWTSYNPASGFSWWHIAKTATATYEWKYGNEGRAFVQPKLSTITSGTTVSSSPATSQQQELCVLYAAIMISLWNHNLDRAASLIGKLEARIRDALSDVDRYLGVRVPQRGAAPLALERTP